MEEITLLKFTQHNDLRSALIATGDAHIEEANQHGDRFWGTVDDQGENMLGIILMKVRDKIRSRDVEK